MTPGGFGLVLCVVASHALAARLLGLRPVLGVVTRGGEPSSMAQRAVVGFAGLLGGYAYCVAWFTVAIAFTGRLEPTLEVSVLAESPAARAGVQDGDRLVSFDGQALRDFDHLRSLVESAPNRTAVVALERGGRSRTVEVTPDAAGRIGVASVERRVTLSATAVCGDAVRRPLDVAMTMTVGFARAALGSERPDLVGPVGIVQQGSRDRAIGEGLSLTAVLMSYLAYLLLLPELVVVVVYLFHRPPCAEARRQAGDE
ncbi:MAG: PDZ domain-containing protein [Polyangiaceae bacterium]|nr:PDZ domain-containing protein [Polyangiaceae bacterium]